MDAAFDAEAAAAVDVDALFAAPPSQQKHMLGDVLQRKIHAVQPEIANEILEELLETADVNELINWYVPAKHESGLYPLTFAVHSTKPVSTRSSQSS